MPKKKKTIKNFAHNTYKQVNDVLLVITTSYDEFSIIFFEVINFIMAFCSITSTLSTTSYNGVNIKNEIQNTGVLNVKQVIFSIPI